MAGERTPSLATAGLPSADDDISLREHMQRQLDVNREMALVRFGLERQHTDEVVVMLREWLAEQDRRYEQRFVAQERAVEVALARVDKEFHEHLRSVQEETRAALLAADKAISKSEAATERRFESVNEFRSQLADQAATFMGRSESLSRHDRTGEAIAEMTKRQETEQRLQRERTESDLDSMRERFQSEINSLTSRLDRSAGGVAGGREAIMDKRTANGAVLALVGMGITIVLAVLAVLTFILAQSGNP